MLYTVLQILALAALGFFLTRLWGWSQNFFQSLSRLLVNVVLPIYFFARISQTDVSDLRRGFFFPLAAMLVIGAGLLFSSIISSVVGLKGKEKRAAVALSGFGNSGIVPLMLIESFPATVPQVADTFGTLMPTMFVGVYLLFQSPVLWSLGNYLVAGEVKKPRWNELLTPPLLGILAGFIFLIPPLQRLLLNPVLPFTSLLNAAHRLGQGVFPLLLLCLGSIIAALKGRVERQTGLALATAAVVRFTLIPACFFAVYFLFLKDLHLSPAVLWVLFLETHTPPATALAIMSMGKNDAVVSPVLLWTYIAYLAVLPAYLLLFLSLPGL
ncbi:MAG: AEC family transporter [Spirochaetaceae bacterium]|nr:MAG: AEC family transporter [Spirochaetaceae bacterium]